MATSPGYPTWMKLILSHHLAKLPRLANPANSDLSRGFSGVHRRGFQGGYGKIETLFEIIWGKCHNWQNAQIAICKGIKFFNYKHLAKMALLPNLLNGNLLRSIIDTKRLRS